MIFLKKLEHCGEIPSYSTSGSAGMDLRAALPENSRMVIQSGASAAVPLGFQAEIPDHLWVQILARSGLAVKKGIAVIAGVIDPDYRGEWKAILYNSGKEDFVIEPGDRIAQAVVHFRSPIGFTTSEEELTITERGSGGFGSTGV